MKDLLLLSLISFLSACHSDCASLEDHVELQSQVVELARMQQESLDQQRRLSEVVRDLQLELLNNQ